MTLVGAPIGFTLPEANLPTEPPEVRGSGRDDVRLMVTHRVAGSIEHDRFANLNRHLRAGDVVVVNNSATLPAAIPATTEDGASVIVHFASPGAGGLWQVEVRTMLADGATAPGPDLSPQTVDLKGGATLHILARNPRTPRLWVAAFAGATGVEDHLRLHGAPVRYTAGPTLPIEAYQTVFATNPGSAEMPSAARPFTPEMVARLVASGVAFVPVTLHAGVSSFEADETPGEERFDVPSSTAAVINALRAEGGRAIAVGTTVLRALETVADANGIVHPGRGTTDLVIGPGRPLTSADGMITGWHEPRSSHLSLLESVLPRPLLRDVYDEGIDGGYLWHEFGDLLLILP